MILLSNHYKNDYKNTRRSYKQIKQHVYCTDTGSNTRTQQD